MDVQFVGGSADQRSMSWPRNTPLPAWLRTDPEATDLYRVDESTGQPRYVHVSVVNNKRGSKGEIPLELRYRSPQLCADTIGQFPVITREMPYRGPRFELWVGDKLVGFYATREQAESIGRQISQWRE